MEADDGTEGTLVFRRSDYDDGTRGPVPEDLRAWIPAVRLVRLVEHAAARLPASAVANADARHLAAVLLWCLATARYGSWDIEALCDEEPLCRHLAGRSHPTHADIQRYRRDHEAELQVALMEMLRVAAPAMDRAGSSVWSQEATRRQERARLADHHGPD